MIPTLSRVITEIAIVYGFLLPSSVYAEDALLKETVERHMATIDFLRTFQCRVVIRYTPGSGEISGEYWRSGRNFRCKTKSNDMLSECEYRDGVTTQYSARNGQPSEGVITDSDMAYIGEAWSYGLQSFYGQDKFRVSLKELVSEKGITASASKAEREGRKMIRIKVVHTRAELDIWLDPDVNYLARHVFMKMKHKKVTPDTESSVLDFKEIVPGVFFPTKVTSGRVGVKDDQASGWDAEFSNVEVNKNISDKDLTVRLPSGILVSDEIRKGVFRTDSSGKPTLPATNSRGQRLALTEASPAPIPDARSQLSTEATLEEPQPVTKWLLPLSIIFFAVAAVIWATKKIRTRIKTEN